MHKLSPSAHFLSLYIAEHTRLVPKTRKKWAANQNWARKKSVNFVSQSESSSTSTESSANQNGVLRHPSHQPIRIKSYVTREPSARVEDPPRLSAPLGSL